MKLTAYLQHGTNTPGPFLTENVPVKETETTPVNRSRSGYGNRLPSAYMVSYCGKWRRVYAICYSNCATLYIGPVSEKIIVQIDRG